MLCGEEALCGIAIQAQSESVQFVTCLLDAAAARWHDPGRRPAECREWEVAGEEVGIRSKETAKATAATNSVDAITPAQRQKWG